MDNLPKFPEKVLHALKSEDRLSVWKKTGSSHSFYSRVLPGQKSLPRTPGTNRKASLPVMERAGEPHRCGTENLSDTELAGWKKASR